MVLEALTLDSSRTGTTSRLDPLKSHVVLTPLVPTLGTVAAMNIFSMYMTMKTRPIMVMALVIPVEAGAEILRLGEVFIIEVMEMLLAQNQYMTAMVGHLKY